MSYQQKTDKIIESVKLYSHHAFFYVIVINYITNYCLRICKL